MKLSFVNWKTYIDEGDYDDDTLNDFLDLFNDWEEEREQLIKDKAELLKILNNEHLQCDENCKVCEIIKRMESEE